MEALLFGNLTAEDATALADAVCAALPGEPMPAAERPLEEVAALPEGSSLLVRRARRGQAWVMQKGLGGGPANPGWKAHAAGGGGALGGQLARCSGAHAGGRGRHSLGRHFIAWPRARLPVRPSAAQAVRERFA